MVWRRVRTRLRLCITFARRGSFSHTCRPLTRVLMGLYWPRTSAGADGFMSTVSWWLGPPHWCRKMTDDAFALRLLVDEAAERTPGTPSVASDRAPTWSRSRRVRWCMAGCRRVVVRTCAARRSDPIIAHFHAGGKDVLAGG